jgi:hypothetical protein
METKICFKCGVSKPLQEFYKHKEMWDGHVNKCKECNKQDVRDNYRANIEYIKAYDKIRKKKGYVKPTKSKRVIKFSMDMYKTFKGSSNEYRNLHHWIESILGKPGKCTNCGRDGLVGRRIHWSNKSGLYKKDVSDWVRLCARCHIIHDRYSV